MKFYDFFVNYPDDRDFNLYIIWDKKQCLYVGISSRNIWNRWFDTGGHLSIYEDGTIIGNSGIGNVIQRNAPESFNYDVELLKIETDYKKRTDLKTEEQSLIKKLRPLCNYIHRDQLTIDEQITHKKYMKLDEFIPNIPDIGLKIKS